ncbi:MAG: DinB family protein [Chitinophagaceae bacterium]|nr:DinB family protein [Chitinophagaceae bacterium]
METKILIQKETISAALNTTITDLLQLLAVFDEAQINVIPFKDSWTAGQLSKHVLMSNEGFIEILNGPNKETQRQADKMVQKIKSDFLDFSTKGQSADNLKPPIIDYNKNALLISLEALKEKISEAIENLDLTKTCTALELPVYGFLTRWEALHFMLYHTQRHIHQLKNILKKVASQ